MKIIDGQMHAWPANTPATPWPEGAVSLHGPQYTIDEALKTIRAAGVDRVVLVPPSWMGMDMSYSLTAAQKMPDTFKVMGRLDVEAKDAKEQLKNYLKTPGMMGLRPVFANDLWLRVLRDKEFEWYWDGCEKAGIPQMCFLSGVVKEIAPHAERHPGATIIVDHAGRNPRGEKDEACWTDIGDLLALAKYPNISVKVSSLPSFSSQPYPFPNLRKPMKQIYDAFGPKRMIWGSDITRLTSTYEENLKLFTEATDFFSKDDLEWIMGRTVAEKCKWPL